jgi:hypothetical protein
MKGKLKVLVAIAVVFVTSTAAALAAASPSVSTGAATQIKQETAVLNGTVNPGGAKTGYRFEWGLTTAYGSSGPLHFTGTGTMPVSVKLQISHLLPGTVYHYRLVALSHVGGAIGSDRTFRTAGHPPPYAATGPATNVSTNGATVNGIVNPNGVSTTWYFQYGISTIYSSQTVTHLLPAASSPVPVAETLFGLQPGTVFHYRIVAINRGVAEYGNDATFMTHPTRRPVPRLHVVTRPRRDLRRPYGFSVTGHLLHPSSIPGQFACSGTVRIHFLLGRRGVYRAIAPVQPNCSFSAAATFKRRPGHHPGPVRLRVLVNFDGTGYLAPARAPQQTVTLG